jgi:hypothetical protein
MNVKKQLGTATTIATVVLAAAAPGVAADTPTPGDAGVAYFRANERATLVQSAGPAAIAYFRANERKTLVSETSAALRGTVNPHRGPLVSEVSTTLNGYVDNNRQPGQAGAPAVEAEPVQAGGFDWQDAAVGASSALMLGLLIGGSLIVVRHSRGRELAR